MPINFAINSTTSFSELNRMFCDAKVSERDKTGVRMSSDKDRIDRIQLSSGGGTLQKIKCFFNVGGARAENRRLLRNLMHLVLRDPDFQGLDGKVRNLFRGIDTNRQVTLGSIKSLLCKLETAKSDAMKKKIGDSVTLALSAKTKSLPPSVERLGDQGEKDFRAMLDKEIRNLKDQDLRQAASSVGKFYEGFSNRFEIAVKNVFGDNSDTPQAKTYLKSILAHCKEEGLKCLEKNPDGIKVYFERMCEAGLNPEEFEFACNAHFKMNLMTFSNKTTQAIWANVSPCVSSVSDTFKDMLKAVTNESLRYGLSQITTAIEENLNVVDLKNIKVDPDRQEKLEDCHSIYLSRCGFVEMFVKVAVHRMDKASREALINVLLGHANLMQYCLRLNENENSSSVLREVVLRDLFTALAEEEPDLKDGIDMFVNVLDRRTKLTDADLLRLDIRDMLRGKSWPVDLNSIGD